MSNDTEKYQQLMETGKCAYAALAEMVAALNCDYERLEELRDDRAAFNAEVEAGRERMRRATFTDAEIFRYSEEAIAQYANPDLVSPLSADDSEELKELEAAAGECESRGEAEQRIHEDPLSVEVRGDWVSYGDQEHCAEPVEFRILLATGGPAVRIMGELSNGEPTRAWLEVQDWFTPWTQYMDADQDVLLSYCRCFYFGE